MTAGARRRAEAHWRNQILITILAFGLAKHLGAHKIAPRVDIIDGIAPIIHMRFKR